MATSTVYAKVTISLIKDCACVRCCGDSCGDTTSPLFYVLAARIQMSKIGAVHISLWLRSSPADPRAAMRVAQWLRWPSAQSAGRSPAYACFSFPTLPLISDVPGAAAPETRKTIDHMIQQPPSSLSPPVR